MELSVTRQYFYHTFIIFLYEKTICGRKKKPQISWLFRGLDPRFLIIPGDAGVLLCAHIQMQDALKLFVTPDGAGECRCAGRYEPQMPSGINLFLTPDGAGEWTGLPEKQYPCPSDLFPPLV
jgi:hypothetical protein